jgi:hypothetical protein
MLEVGLKAQEWVLSVIDTLIALNVRFRSTRGKEEG